MKKSGNDAISFLFLAVLSACTLVLLVSAFCFDPVCKRGTAWQVESCEPVVRLHVRAAGDSPAEQSFKMELVALVQRLLSGKGPAPPASYGAYLSFLHNFLPELENSLQAYAAEAAAGTIAVRLTRELFPLRTYGRRLYPAGRYTALTVTIGEGAGENWWCLLFPSLCFPPARISRNSVEDENAAPLSPIYSETPGFAACGGADKVEAPAGAGRWRIKIWEFVKRPGQQIIEKAEQIFYN